MEIRIIFAIFLLCISGFWCSPINPVPNKQVTEENMILRKIITNYLGKYSIHEKVFISLIHLCEKDQNQFRCEVLHNFLNDLAEAGFAYNVFNKLDNTTRYSNRNSFNLVVVEESTALQEILNEKTVWSMHLKEKFFVILTGHQNRTINLDGALQILWKNYLINSHVLIQDATNAWALYTYLPYQNNCITSSHLRLESFTKSNYSKPMNLSISQVYPKKLENFNECPIYAAAYTIAPGVVLRKATDGRYYYTGHDITIAEEIVKDLNSTVVYILPLAKTEQGMILKNRTQKETLGVVMRGEANFTVGGHTRREELDEMLSPGDAYFYTSFGFTYKQQNAELNAMASILTPFNPSVWLTILLILYFSMLIILMTKNLTRKWRHLIIGGRMNRTPMLNAWVTVLGGSIANPQIANGQGFGNFSRTLTMIWILLWFLVRSYYEGALYHYMQGYQPPPPYDTVEKAIASNCKVLYSVNQYTTIKQYIRNEDRLIQFPTNLTTALDHFLLFHDSKIDGVACASEHVVSLFNVFHFPRRRLSFTKDHLSKSAIVMYFPFKSIIMDLFNQRIKAFHETGLQQYWYMKTYYAHRSRRTPKDGSQSELHFENIAGIIQICSTTYLISFIVFVLEMMTITSSRIRNILDYLNY